MTLSVNQFAPSDVKGDVKNKNAGFRYDGRITHAETATLIPGDAVILADVAGSGLEFLLATAATDDIFGFVQYESAKKNSYAADDYVTIASDYTLIVMEASAAIARGAAVQFVPSGSKVATRTSGKVVGRAMQKAAADTNLIKVLVKADIPST